MYYCWRTVQRATEITPSASIYSLLFLHCFVTSSCCEQYSFIFYSSIPFSAMRSIPKHLAVPALLVGACLLFSGCLKTKIVTDKPASNETSELVWAHGFVNGLVPPINAPLNTEAVCGDAGVSDVYFRQTFVQVIAQGLTSSLYAPQRFSATCASGGMSSLRMPPSYLHRHSNATDVPTPDSPSSESSTTQ